VQKRKKKEKNDKSCKLMYAYYEIYYALMGNDASIFNLCIMWHF